MAVDISDLPPPPKKGADISDLPPPPKKEKPGLGEKIGAGLYGAATGFAGGLGELEKLGAERFAYPIEEGLGIRKPGQGPDKFLGRETLFPTVKESQDVLKAVGINPPRKEVSGSQTIGEVLGGLGPAIPGLAKSGAKALLGTPSVTGESLAREAEQLGFKLNPAQVRQDVPIGSKGSTFNVAQNQTLANRLASKATGKEAQEVNSEFLRDRFKDLGGEFDALYKGKQFTIDQPAIDALRSIEQMEAQLPTGARMPAVRDTAKKVVDNYDSLVKQGGKPGTFKIDGEALQRIRNDLTASARSSSGQDAHFIYELVDEVDKSIAKNHPEVAVKLNEIRPQYRNSIILSDLARQNGINQGNVSLERLGEMLGRRQGSRTMEPGDIDRLGEIGKNLKIRARWQPEGGSEESNADILTKALGTTLGGAATATGLRSSPARAIQRSMAGAKEPSKLAQAIQSKLPQVPVGNNIYSVTGSKVPYATALGTLGRPFNKE